MKIPTRPAPSVPRGEPTRDNYFQQTNTNKPVGQVKPKKKPPPRPPPPKFANSVLYDKTWDFPTASSSNIHNISRKPDFTTSLIDLSAPLDDFFQSNSVNNHTPITNNYSVGNSYFFGNNSNSVSYLDLSPGATIPEPQRQKPVNNAAPTIIRAQPRGKKDFGGTYQMTNDFDNYSPPMPTVPPPSPPKYNLDQAAFDDSIPHGVALYNYFASHKDDLPLQVDDIVVLIREVNEEWLYGKIGDSEGMFPANFIDIRVPLPSKNNQLVTALYDFKPETAEDLKLVPGQKVNVLKRVSKDWLYGESNGRFGQFPANFVDRVPANL